MVLDAIFGPLFEFNPVKYAFNEKYRSKVDVKLGRRAKRIFFYQVFWAILLVAGIFSIVFTCLSLGRCEWE